MVFDGDFDAGIEGLGAAGAADFDGIGNASLDAAFGAAILPAAKDHAEGGRTEAFGHADAQGEVLFGGAMIGPESPRGRANAP